ncbi:hypothetical protein FB45DRAFT_956298, partial [Roridomyces roridus]
TLHDGSIDVIARFNTLRFLTIQYAVPLSPSLLLALLRGLPNLIKLEMYNVIYSPMLAMTRHFTHRNLECLHFGYLEGFIRFSDTSILPLLTLPALQSLLISRDRISETDLHHFLVRSSPPLRYLGIQFREQDLRSPTTIACLGLIPTLTDLQILRPHSWSGVVQALSLFELWATAPDLLPALENLSIEADAEPGTDLYARAVEFLGNRRSSLQSLRLIVPFVSQDSLQNDAVAALRVFRDDGVRVHLGTERMNFL